MALNTNPFIAGTDPTALFGGYASVLLQLVREAYPSSTYGMILFDTTAPDVTGSNAWRKTCIWLDLTLPNTPTLNVYKEGTSPGWINTNVIIANNSISTAMIINGAVTLPKLSVSGGAALQVIRVNATTTAFEFVNVASLITIGSIPIGSLITTGIPPGQLRFAGVFGPTTAQWLTPISIINALVDGSINPDLIGVPGALSARSQFLTARTADTFATYRFLDPNVDILAAAMNGNRITDNTVSVTKISPGAATEGSYMRIVGGVPDWDPAPTSGITTKFVTDLATLGLIPQVVGSPVTLPHNLAQIPTSFRVALICTELLGALGYAFLDEVDAMSLTQVNAGNSNDAFTFRTTSAGIIVSNNNGSPGYPILIANGTTGVYSAIIPSNWRLRLYATYTS
jgi:hypothetical protein